MFKCNKEKLNVTNETPVRTSTWSSFADPVVSPAFPMRARGARARSPGSVGGPEVPSDFVQFSVILHASRREAYESCPTLDRSKSSNLLDLNNTLATIYNVIVSLQHENGNICIRPYRQFNEHRYRQLRRFDVVENGKTLKRLRKLCSRGELLEILHHVGKKNEATLGAETTPLPRARFGSTPFSPNASPPHDATKGVPLWNCPRRANIMSEKECPVDPTSGVSRRTGWFRFQS
ncbi:hypothetical protein EVAR_43889_1 [Eumeta japonica]|uniref:Uncharacterized protein n=1 Tax=Eumeta variegata TaxID=151549 RepID=A0A4C1WMR4_EUMVA|nr:hypothetical protein EVAR_43889_1 [Eumeta japonica]